MIFCVGRKKTKKSKFSKQILFFGLLLLCPRGVKFSSPRTGSESVCGVSEKSNFPKISILEGSARDPLDKRTTKLMSEKASLVEILGKQVVVFSSETPHTDSEPVVGLENLTPRGHNKNEPKNKIYFWKF